MARRRCAVHDVTPFMSPVTDFTFLGNAWDRQDLKYTIGNLPSNFTLNEVEGAIKNAFEKWQGAGRRIHIYSS